MKDNMLEIGDQICSRRGINSPLYIEGEIDRLTKTLAVIGSKKFKREISTYQPGSTINIEKYGARSSISWNQPSYYLFTNELKAEETKRIARREKESALAILINKINVKRLTDERIDQLTELFQEDESSTYRKGIK
jgi:hypothetical protein